MSPVNMYLWVEKSKTVAGIMVIKIHIVEKMNIESLQRLDSNVYAIYVAYISPLLIVVLITYLIFDLCCVWCL